MDGNTRLRTATSAAALRESFGADGQPGSYTDIERCDAIVCVDPRRTPVAEEAERTGGVHLAPKVGTSVELMNGLTRELLANGWMDEEWVQQHTLGLEDLRSAIEPYTPEKVAEICGIDAADLRRAARLFGESDNVLSTVLQGVDLPGFRNWDNSEHVQQLADLWNVDVATNPAVSMPESARIRKMLGGDQCFVIVQDLFLTETAQLADVVLPAAGWGKTGTFTNVNLAKRSDSHVTQMAPIAQRYEDDGVGDDAEEPARLHAEGLAQVRRGQIGLLRDLQGLHVLASLVQTTWTVVLKEHRAYTTKNCFTSRPPPMPKPLDTESAVPLLQSVRRGSDKAGPSSSRDHCPGRHTTQLLRD